MLAKMWSNRNSHSLLGGYKMVQNGHFERQLDGFLQN
jgi:hypothetical protein